MALLRGTGCAEVCGGFVFLRDPKWSPAERDVAEELMRRAEQMPVGEPDGWLCIRTGGSGGGVKFARHDERTLSAATIGFAQHFGLSQVNAVGVLPPWHVSGFMARVRCAATGGEYIGAEWKALERGEFPTLPGNAPWVLSLVPTQLQRLLGSEAALAWLRQFRVVLLGGGPTWPQLAEAAASAHLPVSLTYGMTETAAMITAQLPQEFLAGDRSAGRAMPQGRVRITEDGRVAIQGASLFRGYFPGRRDTAEFLTQDLGRLDENQCLHLLGRADAVIISGGKKVQPLEVEAALRASGEFQDVAVIGVADPEWGEVVVACYPATAHAPDFAAAVRPLADYQRPKRFVAVTEWPRNAQGKINRAALAERVAQL